MVPDGETVAISRRRLLALAGAGAAGLAGCNGSNGSVGTPTKTTTGTVTGTATETTMQTQTGTPTKSAGETDDTVPAGGSRFGPDSGFADPAPWLTDDTPVHTVTEPTREALAEAVDGNEPRVVVFETSGTIDLEEWRFSVDGDDCWIAGQTAPSPGITLTRGDLWLNGNDCVLQHVRVRPGDAGFESDWEPDAIRTGDGTRNVVIDHCTATWSVDENLSAGYNSAKTTISNCLVAEPLADASHHKGPHPYGSLIGDGATDVAIVGNLYAKNRRRNPRLKAETESVVVNNLFYRFHAGTNLDRSTLAAIVGNEYRRSTSDSANIEHGKAFVDRNVGDDGVPMTNDVQLYAGRPLWPQGLDALDGSAVADPVTRYAGARPADRTHHDRRVIEQVENGTGGPIDSQDEVGGYPDLPENTRELSVPDSGLREWLAAHAIAVEEPDVAPPSA